MKEILNCMNFFYIEILLDMVFGYFSHAMAVRKNCLVNQRTRSKAVFNIKTNISCILGQIKKQVCLRSHVKKIQGRSVGINFVSFSFFFFYYRQNRKQSFPESDSGISFSKFPVSRHLLKLFYDQLCSFSTFIALNFDKKLAVE